MNNKKQFKVVSIKELLNNGVVEESLRKVCEELYNITDFLCEDYPKYNSWFYKKHLPAVFVPNSGRDIIFAYDEDKNICGISFIKEDDVEKKICTLFVDQKFRGMGVGTMLVEKSMEKLGTTKPMITLAEYKLPMFESIIKKYGWEKTEEVIGLYNNKYKELVYNGYLSK